MGNDPKVPVARDRRDFVDHTARRRLGATRVHTGYFCLHAARDEGRLGIVKIASLQGEGGRSSGGVTLRVIATLARPVLERVHIHILISSLRHWLKVRGSKQESPERHHKSTYIELVFLRVLIIYYVFPFLCVSSCSLALSSCVLMLTCKLTGLLLECSFSFQILVFVRSGARIFSLAFWFAGRMAWLRCLLACVLAYVLLRCLGFYFFILSCSLFLVNFLPSCSTSFPAFFLCVFLSHVIPFLLFLSRVLTFFLAFFLSFCFFFCFLCSFSHADGPAKNFWDM